MQRIFCNKISLQKLNKNGLHKIDKHNIKKLYFNPNNRRYTMITQIKLSFIYQLSNKKAVHSIS